ncbi:hypothetical protein PoB_006638400 [Plakobranchus ocellatus]|uniref:Uncharacterized protein n=1 Tax=Plakobranchus ocellatus TaxID=259542 RepID=A0AAV4D6Q4_9GAST|nr:hypothetical protein PoB_006638400 [Plakobranchus ocellatus]
MDAKLGPSQRLSQAQRVMERRMLIIKAWTKSQAKKSDDGFHRKTKKEIRRPHRKNVKYQMDKKNKRNWQPRQIKVKRPTAKKMEGQCWAT